MSVQSRLCDWLDDRTGYRHAVSEALYENIPGGSRWIYVTGSMLVFAFVTQVVTGIFLWTSYSPGSQNAWESVYYIQNVMQGGWLLRGVHHYMAQAMVVLLPLHLLQVVLCRAYVPPREINYWLGLVLMLIVLALGLTGYLLPWDQKGYWATRVATELMSLPPGGGMMQKLVVGGSEYGHLTLTRFFALHAGILPGLLVAVLVLHVAMFRKHGITARSSERRTDEFFWPQQVFKDAAACFLLLVAVIGLVLWRGTELGPPAEPTQAYGAARPEWYFLFLFELLKKFETPFMGAIVVPGLVMAFLFAMPLIARVRYLHVMNVAVLLVLVGSAAYLTYEAVDHDNYHVWHPEPPQDEAARALWEERVESSRDFHAAKAQVHREAERVQELIEHYGIPTVGAAEGLVNQDPEIQGPRIFARNCASCHRYVDPQGQGIAGPEPPPDWDGITPYGAPNLFEFASRRRLANFFTAEGIVSPDNFGTCAHGLPDADGEYKSGGMVEFVRDSEFDQEVTEQLAVAISAEAELPYQRELDAASSADGSLEAAREAVANEGCIDCHSFRGEEGYGGPDLTGYFSYDWLYAFIADPSAERFYTEENNDRMPAYAAHPDDPSRNLLSHHELDMLVRWLRGDDRELGSEEAEEGGAGSAEAATAE